MMKSPFASIIAKNYHVKDYFPKNKQPAEKPSKDLDYRKVNPVAFAALSSKIDVEAQALIEEGPQQLKERTKSKIVYSAQRQLNVDASIIKEWNALAKDIGHLKEKYQKLIVEMKDKRPSITPTSEFTGIKEDLEKYQKAFKDFSTKKRALEARYLDLEEKVTARVAKDKLGSSEPLKKTVDTFAARNKIDVDQVLADLSAIRSNTVEISNIPNGFQTAITDAETVLPDFRYYFDYLWYLCSEKIGDTYANRGYFYEYQANYNFIDRELYLNNRKGAISNFSDRSDSDLLTKSL